MLLVFFFATVLYLGLESRPVQPTNKLPYWHANLAVNSDGRLVYKRSMATAALYTRRPSSLNARPAGAHNLPGAAALPLSRRGSRHRHGAATV